MNTNRSKSTTNKLQVQRKNQKNPQEEFGAEVNHESTERNHMNEKRNSKESQPPSERTAWN